MHELGGQDLEAGLLEASDDLPGHLLGDGVGLDDGERALYGHEREVILSGFFYSALTSGLRPSARSAGPISARNSSTDHLGHGNAHVGGARDGGDARGLHG